MLAGTWIARFPGESPIMPLSRNSPAQSGIPQLMRSKGTIGFKTNQPSHPDGLTHLLPPPGPSFSSKVSAHRLTSPMPMPPPPRESNPSSRSRTLADLTRSRHERSSPPQQPADKRRGSCIIPRSEVVLHTFMPSRSPRGTPRLDMSASK